MKLLIIFSLSVFTIAVQAQQLTQHVDPRIGSEGEGRTFIGPSTPFGVVKPGPDGVTMPNAGWMPMPELIKGFSQTHVSGTGGGQKYGNVLVQPLSLSPDSSPVGRGKTSGLVAFMYNKLLLPDGRLTDIPIFPARRQKEEISLGYYSCTYDNGVTTEITAAPRCAVYRFTGADALFVDAASFLGMDTIPDKRETQQYVGSEIKVTGANELCGRTTVRGGWNNGSPYTVYFCLQKDADPADKTHKSFPKRGGKSLADSSGTGGVITFDSLAMILPLADSQKSVTVRIGISYVSIDRARRNISPLSFDAQLASLRNSWEHMLSKVPYKGTEKEERMFYTALYHTLLMPVDKTGEAPKRWGKGNDAHIPLGKGRKSGTRKTSAELAYFDDYYAIWDTYRTSFPLLMEYYPDVAVKMINSLLNIYQHEGYMPDARSGDCNGRTQGGSNAEVVIAEAFARKLKGIDYELALEAMIKDAEVPPADDEKEGRGGLREYNRLGYIPYGIPRAGTRTIEYSYDDRCIAQVARGLGHNDLYKKYMKRSKNWQNLWRADYVNSRNQSNDLPIFRYADILMEKAEAIARGASATNGETVQSLMNQIRTYVNAPTYSSTPSLDDIYNERGRELFDECWRRNDMIRFGHFEDEYGFHRRGFPTARFDKQCRVFPIPTDVLNTNTNWSQNPGY